LYVQLIENLIDISLQQQLNRNTAIGK